MKLDIINLSENKNILKISDSSIYNEVLKENTWFVDIKCLDKYYLPLQKMKFKIEKSSIQFKNSHLYQNSLKEFFCWINEKQYNNKLIIYFK